MRHRATKTIASCKSSKQTPAVLRNSPSRPTRPTATAGQRAQALGQRGTTIPRCWPHFEVTLRVISLLNVLCAMYMHSALHNHKKQQQPDMPNGACACFVHVHAQLVLYMQRQSPMQTRNKKQDNASYNTESKFQFCVVAVVVNTEHPQAPLW
jgi:hypothetical protein